MTIGVIGEVDWGVATGPVRRRPRRSLLVASRDVMDFLILGPLAVYDHGSEVPIDGHKERSLLAMLLLEDGRLVSADRLVDELWGDQPPPTARSSLQVRIAGLRRALGKQRIISEGRGYRIHLERGELDVERFSDCSIRAEPGG